MPKPNYAYEKRQRELAKKKKKEEKLLRKTAGPAGEAEQAQDDASAQRDPSEETADPGSKPADSAERIG